jgi:programmed cell death 6-interacting protein
MEDYIPSTSSASSSSAPKSVQPLRASLEHLDDRLDHRATLVAEAKQMARGDDPRAEVLQEATKLAHGGSGDVKAEWFEGIFEKRLSRYERVREDMRNEVGEQEKLLEEIRVRYHTSLNRDLKYIRGLVGWLMCVCM